MILLKRLLLPNMLAVLFFSWCGRLTTLTKNSDVVVIWLETLRQRVTIKLIVKQIGIIISQKVSQ